MNNERRAEIRSIVDGLHGLLDRLDDVYIEEEDAQSRVPDNLKGQNDSLEALDTATGHIIAAEEYLSIAIT